MKFVFIFYLLVNNLSFHYKIRIINFINIHNPYKYLVKACKAGLGWSLPINLPESYKNVTHRLAWCFYHPTVYPFKWSIFLGVFLHNLASFHWIVLARSWVLAGLTETSFWPLINKNLIPLFNN